MVVRFLTDAIQFVVVAKDEFKECQKSKLCAFLSLNRTVFTKRKLVTDLFTDANQFLVIAKIEFHSCRKLLLIAHSGFIGLSRSLLKIESG